MNTSKKIEPRTLKGFRDFLPDEAAKRLWLTNKLRQIFESYGFLPLETPALEYLETFSGQIGEDEKMFYRFEDQGGREVAMRYDQTVPTCRVVAQYCDQLTFPFKRYQIQPVWRAEKPQKGRYREFVQCDADIFGEAGPEADAEMILLSIDIYRQLGFEKAMVLVNDRELFAQANIPYPAISAIDKLEKIGRQGVIEELIAKGYKPKKAGELLDQVLDFKPTERIRVILDTLKQAGFDENWFRFEPTLARSFSYSTGPIWEIVISDLKSSVLGGERFDQLVSTFSKKPVPATGFALGFDRTLEALEEERLLPADYQTNQVLVTVFSPNTRAESLRITQQLRQAGLNTETYTNPSDRLPSQLRYADRKQIPIAVILGPDEIKKNQVTVKNLKTMTQETVGREKTVELIKKELA